MSCNVVCRPHCQFVVSLAFGLFKNFTPLRTNQCKLIFGGGVAPQQVSCNATVQKRAGGGLIPVGPVLRQPSAPAHLGKSDVFDSSGCSAAVLAPPRQISPDKPLSGENAFLRITLALDLRPTVSAYPKPRGVVNREIFLSKKAGMHAFSLHVSFQ